MTVVTGRGTGVSKMGRKPLYTAKQRDRVLALRTAGMTVRAIAAETGVNKTSVHRICKQYGAA